MEIHYKKAISIGFIIFGAIFVIIYFILNDSSITRLGLALFLMAYGFLTLTKPYFIIKEDSLELIAILGPAKKTYSFDSIHDLQIENNKIYLTQNGNREKLPISKWMVENLDWELMIQKINA